MTPISSDSWFTASIVNLFNNFHAFFPFFLRIFLKMNADPVSDHNYVVICCISSGTSASPLVLNLANIHARLSLSLLRSGLQTAGSGLQVTFLKYFEEFFSNKRCVLSPEVFQLAVGLAWPGALAIAEGELHSQRRTVTTGTLFLCVRRRSNFAGFRTIFQKTGWGSIHKI